MCKIRIKHEKGEKRKPSLPGMTLFLDAQSWMWPNSLKRTRGQDMCLAEMEAEGLSVSSDGWIRSTI